MSFMQKITKAMDKAGKQTSKAIVKGKIMAMQKMANAEATAELPEIVGALERLKATKNEISSLADVARYLYDARINEANYQVDMSHQMRDARSAEEDGWSKLCVAFGNAVSRLESIHSEHCEKMKEEFVLPLEKFRDVDVAEVQKLKLKYKEAKSAFDVAAAKEHGAKESGQAQKMQQAFAKKQEAEADLKRMRTEFLKAVEGLERQKNTELLGLVKDYFGHYVAFGKAQSNALQANPLPNDIDPGAYVGGQFVATTPGADEDMPNTNFNEYPGQGGLAAQGAQDEEKNGFNNLENNDSNNNNNNNNMYGNDGEAVEVNGQGYDENDENQGTNPFDSGYGGQENQQYGDYSNPTDDYNENNENNNNNNNNNYDNNNDDNGYDATNPFGNMNDNGDGGSGIPPPAPAAAQSDPMDFDPYEQANNNQNYGQQNRDGAGAQSVASSQGGFL